MSYYMSGDFYSGDPGLFSIIKKIGGAALSLVPGGGLVRTAARGVGAALAHRAPAAIQHSSSAIVKSAHAGMAIARAHPGATAAAAGAAALGAGALMRHRGAAGRMGAGAIAPGGFRRPSRRIRVTNIKALRRAIRRANGFARIARKVLHFTSPRAPKGRAIFRIRRRGGASKRLKV